MSGDRLAMDRIGKRMLRLNSEMLYLREAWPALDSTGRRQRFEKIQEGFASLITPGAYPESWRYLAEANGVVILPARLWLAVRRWLRKAWLRVKRRLGAK